MVEGYKKFSKETKVTTVGICTSPKATQTSLSKQVDQYGIKPFASVLDSGETAAAFGLKPDSVFSVAVLDGDGKALYAGSPYRFWTHNKQPVWESHVEKAAAAAPGMLSLQKVPDAAREAVHLFNLQQLEPLEKELQRLATQDKSEEIQKFVAQIREHTAALRKKWKESIEALAASDPIRAFAEATAFQAALPGTPEAAAMKALASKLASNPKVKREKEAEEAYIRAIIPLYSKVNTRSQWASKVKPTVDQFLNAYGDTQYVKSIKPAIDAQKDTLAPF